MRRFRVTAVNVVCSGGVWPCIERSWNDADASSQSTVPRLGAHSRLSARLPSRRQLDSVL